MLAKPAAEPLSISNNHTCIHTCRILPWVVHFSGTPPQLCIDVAPCQLANAKILCLLLLLWLVVDRVGARGTAFSSGAAAMGLHLLTLWTVQIAHGSLYHWLGLMTAVFMAGSAAGALLAGRVRLPHPELVTEGLFVLWAGAGWFALPAHLPLAGFALFAAGTGLLLGWQFPLLARAAGSGAYAADALGGCCAALAFGAVIIPVWGFDLAMLTVVFLKLVTLQWWLTRRPG